MYEKEYRYLKAFSSGPSSERSSSNCTSLAPSPSSRYVNTPYMHRAVSPSSLVSGKAAHVPHRFQPSANLPTSYHLSLSLDSGVTGFFGCSTVSNAQATNNAASTACTALDKE